MFTHTWNKYLPIIRILMKRSGAGNQTLDMNRTDFERAAGGRKIKFTFSLSLHKGRIQNMTQPPPLAKEFAALLQQDEMSRKLIRQFDYEFSMNSSFQLLIKNSTPLEVAEETTEAAAGESGENAEENTGKA